MLSLQTAQKARGETREGPADRAQGTRLVQPASGRSISSRQQGTILPDLEPVSRPPCTVSTNSPLLQPFI